MTSNEVVNVMVKCACELVDVANEYKDEMPEVVSAVDAIHRAVERVLNGEG